MPVELAANATLWSGCAEGRLRIKEWPEDDSDGEAVVYDLANGDTHAVEPLMLELLHMLALGAPRSTESLTMEMCALFEAEAGTALADGVASRVDHSLVQLQELGLITGRLA
ncbi:hypothetical protein BH11PSE9_BH11PSE9_24760 [soil metagenome]